MAISASSPCASASGGRLRYPDPGSSAGTPGYTNPTRRPFGSCYRFVNLAAFAIGKPSVRRLNFGFALSAGWARDRIFAVVTHTP